MTTATQLRLPGITLPAGRPLVPLSAIVVLADRNEDDVLYAIETGAIAWAWDIASAGSKARELRCWRNSVLGYLAGLNQGADLEDSAVIAAVLAQVPKPGGDLKSTELQRLFSCGSTHIHDLINEGALVELGKRQVTTGPNAFSRVTRASVAQFLTKRRITG